MKARVDFHLTRSLYANEQSWNHKSQPTFSRFQAIEVEMIANMQSPTLPYYTSVAGRWANW